MKLLYPIFHQRHSASLVAMFCLSSLKMLFALLRNHASYTLIFPYTFMPRASADYRTNAYLRFTTWVHAPAKNHARHFPTTSHIRCGVVLVPSICVSLRSSLSLCDCDSGRSRYKPLKWAAQPPSHERETHTALTGGCCLRACTQDALQQYRTRRWLRPEQAGRYATWQSIATHTAIKRLFLK